MLSSATCKKLLQTLDCVDDRLRDAEEIVKTSFDIVKDTSLMLLNNVYVYALISIE